MAGRSPAAIERAAAAVGAWKEVRSRSAGAAEVERLREAAVAAFGAVGLTEGALALLDNEVVLSMLEAAPDQALAAVRAPVLAIYGSKDEVIAPSLSVAAAEAALGDNPDALAVAVPGMTHDSRARDLRRLREAPPGMEPCRS